MSNERQAARAQGAAWLAQILSKEKSLNIKHLRHCDTAMTAAPVRWALLGAPVEFSIRANAGFAHG
jgi:hypothetical protein